MEINNELKEIAIENRTCYYFDDVIDIEDTYFDNFLLDEKLYKNTWIYVISNKNWFVQNHRVLGLIK